MRVLHLTSEYPPVIWGGLGTAVGGLTTASALAGIEVDVLLVRHANAMSYGQRVTTYEVRRNGTNQAPSLVTLFEVPYHDAISVGLRLVRERKPDVVHIHPVELWPVAKAIKEQTDTPVVYTVHSLNLAEYEVGKEPPEILNLWHTQRALILGADRVLALTEDERMLLLEACPAVRDRIRIVGNGIADTSQARATARKQKGACSPLVLFTGRFVDRKGIHELLAAIPLVLAHAPRTRFVLIGGYGNGEDIERAWLPPSLYCYRDRIHFTGWLRPDEVAAWYEIADVLVVPSWYEPFGMVVLEGMLNGLAIAASNVGGPMEILRHEQTGLLFPPKDANALAQAVLTLVTNESLRNQLGSAAAVSVRRHWLWRHIVHKLAQVYQEAITVNYNPAKGIVVHDCLPCQPTQGSAPLNML